MLIKVLKKSIFLFVLLWFPQANAKADIYSTVSNSRVIFCSVDIDATPVLVQSGVIRGSKFVAIEKLLRKLRKKIKHVETRLKKRRLRKSLRRWKALEPGYTQACKDAIDRDPSDPGATPSPTPSASPSPEIPNFDQNGNTRVGVFGIPLDLSGNISIGANLYANNCTACHSERTNREYPDLIYALNTVPDMQHLERDEGDAILRQNVADLTAFLNRYREYD